MITCSASGERLTLKRLLTVNGTRTGHRAKVPATCMMMMMMLRSSKFESNFPTVLASLHGSPGLIPGQSIYGLW
jgi:hypothetical protein